jgi:hypothetical protein
MMICYLDSAQEQILLQWLTGLFGDLEFNIEIDRDGP